MPAQFKLDPRDWERFGGPEWVTFDRDQLDDLPFDEIHQWETQIGMGIKVLILHEFARATAIGIKGAVWLARQMSGVTEPRFADFNIRALRVRTRAAEVDADPPVSGSSEPSSE